MNQTAASFPELTGFVIKYGKSFWKVTGPAYRSFGESFYYPTIKCTSRGKEFRDTHGISVKNVINQWREAGEPQIINTVGLKADIDQGVEHGKVKRRILFLQERIRRDQEELKKLGVV